MRGDLFTGAASTKDFVCSADKLSTSSSERRIKHMAAIIGSSKKKIKSENSRPTLIGRKVKVMHVDNIAEVEPVSRYIFTSGEMGEFKTRLRECNPIGMSGRLFMK